MSSFEPRTNTQRHEIIFILCLFILIWDDIKIFIAKIDNLDYKSLVVKLILTSFLH